MNTTPQNPFRNRAHWLATASLAVALAGCTGNTAPNTNARESLIFPETALPVTIDGAATDPAWASSFDYRLEDGAMLAAATMRGVTDADNLYLYFEVEDGQDEYDVIVLAFNQDGDPNNYKRIHIYPCFLSTGGACSGTPAGHDPTIEYFSGPLSGTGITWASDSAPAGVEVKSNYVAGGGGSSSLWSVELKLPRSIYSGFPASDAFAMFASVIATDDGIISTAREYSWPAGTLIYSATLDSAPLNTQRWGNVSLDASTASAGLQITGFSSNLDNPGQIALDQTNEFFATVGNLSAGGAAPATVNGVTATYKIANFGLPGGISWTDIPSASNPTSAVNVGADEYRTLPSGGWDLATSGNWAGSGMSEFDFFTANNHQCVKVEVNNTSGIASFTRQYNMSFVTVNSPFESNAEIAIADWREQVQGADRIVLREGFANLGRLSWSTKFEGVDAQGERAWSLPLEKVQDRNRRIDMVVDPDDRLRIPSRVFELGSEPMKLPAKPGSVVTLLVGENEKARRSNERQKEGGSVVSPQTVVASIDGFETSFAIGSGQTFLMPMGSDQLQIRYVGERQLQAPLVAQMVTTGITPAVRRALPFITTLRDRKTPTLLPLTVNMPFHYVRGDVVTNRSIRIRDREFFEAMPMGSFTHTVRSIGPVRAN